MISSSAFKLKNQLCELSGVTNEINQAVNPVSGGYSIELVADWYGNVFVSKPRSEYSAGISV